MSDMKTAGEIVNEILAEVENRPVFFREQDVVDLIAQAQKEAYNQAIDDAVNPGEVDMYYDENVGYCILKQSILKLKK